MSKTLIIAEKPSVAADLARALGKFKKVEDWYENEDCIIGSAVGHLVELCMPQDIDPAFKSWKPALLPILPPQFPLKPIEKNKRKFDQLRQLMRRADVTEVINACDAGREGELIFAYLYELAGCKKTIRRLWMQSMTQEAIREAFKHLREHSEMIPLQEAARCRSESDWLIGINGTRAITGAMFPGRMGQIATVGRVQTPTLTLVTERENQIQAFKPQPYWRITGQFQIHAGHYEGIYQRPDFKKAVHEEDRIDRIWEKEAAEAVLQSLPAGLQGEVTEEKKRAKQQPPRLYNLTGLQREANSRFGFPAGMTLKIAQSLYEKHKVLTYPRTDAKALPEDYGPECQKVLKSLQGEYAPHAQTVLQHGWVNPKNKQVFNNTQVSDHFAIIPTEQSPEKLSLEEQKIYDMVTRRFLAVFFPAAEFDVTLRKTRVQDHLFKTEGRILAVPGWMQVYGRQESAQDALPALSPQDGAPPQAKLLQAQLKEDITRPPARYSDATLLASMEGAGKLVEDEELAEAMKGKGLGTPATRAQIIDHLIQEHYLLREGKDLVPTPKAHQLIAYLKAMQVEGLTSPSMTGEWEHKLHQIEQKSLTRKQFMESIQAFTQEIVQRSKTFDESQHGATPCSLISPTDQKPMLETLSSYRSQCGTLTIPKVTGQRRLQLEEVERLLKEGRIGPLDGFVSKMGKPFSAFLFLEEGKVKFGFGEASPAASGTETGGSALDFSGLSPIAQCPKDGAPVYETVNAYVCAHYPEKTCSFKVARTILGQTVPREQFLKLLAHKKTDLLDKFRSNRTKRLFSAHLVLKDDYSIGFEFAAKAPKASVREKEEEDKPAAAKPAKSSKKKAAASAETDEKPKRARKSASLKAVKKDA